MSDSPIQREITTLLTRVAEYPALDGLAEIKQRIERLLSNSNECLSPAAEAFLAGIEQDRNGHLEKSVELLLRCCELALPSEQRLVNQANVYLGSIYIELGNNFLAYHHYKLVLDRVAELDPLPLTMLYTNLGSLFLQLRCNQEAIRYGDMAILACGDAEFHQIRIIALANTGLATARLHQVDQAIKLLEEALAVATQYQVDRTLGLAHSSYALALSECAPDRHEQIEHHFVSANRHLQGMESNFDSLENRLHYCKFLLQQQRLEEAVGDWDALSQAVHALGSAELNHRLSKLNVQRLFCLGDLGERLTAQELYIDQLEDDRLASLQREGELILNHVSQLERRQNLRIAQKVNDSLDVITELGQLIATAEELDEAMPQVFAGIKNIFPAQEFGIALYDNNRNILDYRYFIGDCGHIAPVQIDCDKVRNFGTYVISSRQTVHLNHITEDTLRAYSNNRGHQHDNPVKLGLMLTQSALLTPVILGNEVLGMLSVQATAENQYQQHHRQLFEHLARLIAIALKNLRQKADLQQSYQELEWLSKTDQLTKVYNRHHLKAVVPKLVEHCAASGSALAICLIDVDFFKGYNDLLGHYAGDQALIAVADAMRFSFDSPSDCLFRYGGDELLVICTDLSQIELEGKLQKLQQRIASLAIDHPRSQCGNCLTLSIGAVYCRQMGGDTRQFNLAFDMADKQLYRVKEQGRNGYQLAQFHEHPPEVAEQPPQWVQ